MSIPLQKFREIVFQVLYSFDMGNSDHKELARMLMKELNVTQRTLKNAMERAEEILEKKDELDDKIKDVSISYSFDRVPIVEKNILRLALFELFFDKEIPPKVAIAEAIRLSRKFSTPESASFINALLDQTYKNNLQLPDS